MFAARLVWLSCVALASSTFTNVKVHRLIDVTTPVVKITTDIDYTLEIGEDQEYHVIVPADQFTRLSALVATTCNDAPCTVSKLSEDAVVTTYRIDMDKPLPQGHIQLVGYYTRVLTAFPAAIRQSEQQFVVYTDRPTFPSPYVTASDTTTLKLPNDDVASYARVQPTALKGTTLKYGPYVATRPFNGSDDNATGLRVHFRHHAPFLQLTQVVKEIEVSMWGAVSVEEVVDAVHAGASLKGGFSRFDYAHRGQVGASIKAFTATFPRRASEVYYRDIIGKILTSDTMHKKKKTVFHMTPRFPLFGGWQTQWYMGYRVPTEDVLARVDDGRTFSLTMNFSSGVDKAAIDALTTKVILPEGASNIRVTVPFAVKESLVRRHTYLDNTFVGRPVLVLEKRNVVPLHNAAFTVTFDFNAMYLWHEPLLLFAGYLSVFLLVMVFSRVDLTISPLSKKTLKTKTN